MKREQLDKINGLLNQIAEMEKVLAIKSDKINILEHEEGNFNTYRGDSVHVITIYHKTLVPVILECIVQLKAELKDLGYEEE